MAGELQINYPTGATLYALLFNAAGQVWNGSTFEAVQAANWVNYDIALAEVATTQCYKGNMPAASAGVYGFVVRKQAGGSPAVGDITVGSGKIEWSGTAELPLSSVLIDVQAATATVSSGTTITVYRGTTWSVSITGLGNLSAYNTIYFSVKRNLDEGDNRAVLRVRNVAAGLERFNSSAPTASNGTITVDNATAGNITITIQEAETQNAPLGNFLYDIKGIDDDGSVVELSSGGTFTIAGDVTRAITSPA